MLSSKVIEPFDPSLDPGQTAPRRRFILDISRSVGEDGDNSIYDDTLVVHRMAAGDTSRGTANAPLAPHFGTPPAGRGRERPTAPDRPHQTTTP